MVTADLIDIWLNTHRSPHTQRGYTADATAFMAFTGKSLRQMTVKGFSSPACKK
jgi:hypothetical protein